MVREVLTPLRQTKLKHLAYTRCFNLVRMRGLEPPCLTALAPKTSVSTIPPHPQGEVNCAILQVLAPIG
jgi:hypothetical protein